MNIQVNGFTTKHKNIKAHGYFLFKDLSITFH